MQYRPTFLALVDNRGCSSFNITVVRASVSFWSLLIIESVACVSQQVLFTHDLLVKQV